MKKLYLPLLTFLCLLSFSAFGQYTWTNGGGTGLWSTPSNWSPAGPPVAGSTVTFNGTSTANCTQDVGTAILLNTINITAAYTGTINGGTTNITLSTFSQAGGTFINTSGTLEVTSAFTVTGGTFNSGIGLVYFNGASGLTINTCNTTIHRVTIGGAGAPGGGFNFTFTSCVTPLTIDSILTTIGGAGNFYFGGAVNVTADTTYLNNTGTGGGNTNTTVFTWNGSGTQVITGFNSAGTQIQTSCGLGAFAKTKIQKAATDTLKFFGYTSFTNDWEYVSGVINTVGTVCFVRNMAVRGSNHTISDLDFEGCDADLNGLTLTSDSALIVSGALNFIRNGNISAKKDLITTTFYYGQGGGNATINIDGTGAQTFYCNSPIGASGFPNVVINKTSGTLNITKTANPGASKWYPAAVASQTATSMTSLSCLAGTTTFLCNACGVMGNWTYTAGTITGDGIVSFNGSGNVITGSHTLPNIAFGTSTSGVSTKTIASSTTLTTGDMYTMGCLPLQLDNGTIQVNQDIEVGNKGTSATGTATIIVAASVTDTMRGRLSTPIGTGAYRISPNEGRLPNIIINKPSASVLHIIDTINVFGNWTYTDGTVSASSASPHTSSVYFYGSGKTIDGQNASTTMAFYNMLLGDANTRTLQGDVQQNNVLAVADGWLSLNGYRNTVNNTANTAITRLTGGIISETSPPSNYGRVQWNVGSSAAGTSYVVPFTQNATSTTYVPFTYQVTTPGTAGGGFAVATYQTDWTLSPNNRPLPTGVTNINNLFGADNSFKEVDRFWIIDTVSFTTAPTATFKYRYQTSEWSIANNAITETRLKAHQWSGATSQWNLPTNSSTRDTLNNEITFTGQKGGIYALVDSSTPDLFFRASDSTICAGVCINFFDANATAPSSYLWTFSGGTPSTSTAANPTNICYSTPGSYTVKLQATYPGGTITDSIVGFITVTAGSTLSTTKTDITCNGSNNGTITLTPTGGGGPYTVTWSPGTGGLSRTGLAAGTYNATVTDGLGCTPTASVTIVNPPALTASITSQTNVSCNGLCDGTVTITPSGGTGAYTHSWSGSGTGTGATRSGLCAGTYRDTVRDANNCSTIVVVTITQPTAVSASIPTRTNVTCNGLCNGTATASASGGRGGTYTYVWSSGTGSGNSVTGLCAGGVTVTVRDSALCSATASVTITQPTSVTATITSQTNVTCNGLCNGSVTVSPSGGTSPYTHSWSGTGSGTGVTRSNLCAGTVNDTIRDANGCQFILPVTITQPTAVSVTIPTTTNVTCNGLCNGSATASASGGRGGTYTYSWSSGTVTTANPVVGLCAGGVTVTVRDSALCSATASVTITQPAALTASITSQTNVSCNGLCDGTATVTPAGGTSPYTHSWSGSGTGTGPTRSGLCAGTYRDTVRDANNCSTIVVVTITQPTAVSASIPTSTNVTCNGLCNGTATASASGGRGGTYTYTWSSGTVTTANPVTGLCAGGVTVTVRDSALCSATASVTITQPTSVTATIASQTNISCNGVCTGSVTVTPSGGTSPYTHSWSGAGSGTGATRTNLCVGTVNDTIRDANGCQFILPVTITQPTAVSGAITAQTNVTCFGLCNGSVTVTPSGGTGAYTHSWSGAGTGTGGTRTGLCAGTYRDTIRDAANCSTIVVVTITEPAVLDATIGSQTNATCLGNNNGQVTINTTGGTTPPAYAYAWTPASLGTSATASGLAGGTYTVTVTDVNGCRDSVTVNILQPAVITASIISTTNVLCFGQSNGTATAAAAGGTSPYGYVWSPTGATGTGATHSTGGFAAGGISVIITDNAGCKDTATATITQPTVLNIDTIFATNATCGCNGRLIGTASGGTAPYNFVWNPGSLNNDTITNLCPGTYILTVTDGNFCTKLDTATITGPTPLIATVTATTNLLCNGVCTGRATVTPTGGVSPYTIVWPSGRTGFTDTLLCAGTYIATVTDAGGCTDTAVATITQPSVLTASSTQTNVTCFGLCNGTATVTPAGGTAPYTHAWSGAGSGSGGNRTGLCAGTYNDTVRDANGCSTIVTVTITEPTALTASSTQTNVSCFGLCDATATVTPSGGTAPYTHSWSGAGSGSAGNRTNLCAGTYNDTVRDANNCVTIVAITITQPTAVDAVLSTTNVSCNGVCDGRARVTTTGGRGGTYTYTWAPVASALDSVVGLCAGGVTVIATDSAGCRDTTIGTITEPTVLSATFTQVNATCNGVCNGSATVTPSGGTAPYTHSWSGSGTGSGATRTNLCAGVFRDTVRDANGCSTIVVITITEPTALTASSTQTNATCNGQCDGTATITPSGGTPPYTHFWTGGGSGTGGNRTNMCAGAYRDSMVDANGCFTLVNITINEPTAIQTNIAVTANVSCNGLCDGRARANTTGGRGGTYTYIWSPVASSLDSVVGLCAGGVTVIVADSAGCRDTATATITQPAAVQAAISATTNVSCNGLCDGTATSTTSGGVGSFTYVWSSGTPSGQSVTGLCAGGVTVIATDAAGCSDTANTTITEPPVLTATIDSFRNASCFGVCDGFARVIGNGGTPTYSYLWSNGGTTAAISNLCDTTYIVAITDANGCVANDTVIITEPTLLTASSVQTNATCNGQCNGTATVTPSGGTAPYTHSWSGAGTGTGAIRSNLCAGTYTDTVRDANNCQTIVTVTITEPAAIQAIINVTANVSCFGLCDGEANATVTGGVGGYVLNWSSGTVAGLGVTDLCAGTLTLIATDTAGCADTTTANITQPPALFATIDSVRNASCNGVCDGFVRVVATGGLGAYNYNWSRGDTTSSISTVCAGTYSVTLADGNGCTAADTAVVTEPAPLVITLVNLSNATCNNLCNGSIDINVTGGTSPYSYVWSNGATSQDIGSLCDGQYIVNVTDANGCTISDTFNITEPPVLVADIDSVRNISCFGVCDGFVSVAASGGTPGYTYLWSNGGTSTSISGLCPGTYRVTVTDANGCTAIDSATVTQPPLLTVRVDSVRNVSCNGLCDGFLQVSGQGGTPPFAYAWSNGPTTVTNPNLCAGNYFVTITDQNGCTARDTIDITQPPVLTVVIDSIRNASCFNVCDGLARATASGGTPGYNYAWSNGPISALNGSLCDGQYIVVVTDAAGCTASDTVVITEPAELVASITASTNLLCNNVCTGTATVTVVGGTTLYTYAWPNGDNGATADSLCAGTFVATITDANGCTDTAAVTITQPTLLTVSITSSTNISCFGVCDGQAIAAASGGVGPYAFSWSPGALTNDTIGNLCAGTYIVTATDANGCTASDTVTLTQPLALFATIDSVRNASCNAVCDGFVSVSGSGGLGAYTYLWSRTDVTPSISNVCAGTYSVTITDGNGCTAADTATVTEPPVLVATITDSANLSCNASCDGGAIVVATGGTPTYTYLWNPGGLTNDTVSNLCANTYAVTVTDANGCTAADTVVITEPPVLTVDITASTNLLCNNVCIGTAEALANGGTPTYTYTWDNGDVGTIADSLCAGIVRVTLTDANGCVALDSIDITQPPVLTATIIDTTNLDCFNVCDGGAVIQAAGGTPGYTYQWNSNPALNNDTLTGQCAGLYIGVVTDANNCTAADTIQIAEPTLLTATITAQTNATCSGTCNGNATVTAAGGTAPYTYLWSNGDVSTTADTLCATSYSVIVTDANGCTATDTVIITEPPVLIVDITSFTNVTCFGACNGTASATGSGGTPGAGYTYNWGTQTGPNATNLCPGFYTVTITDANGCIAGDTVTITEPSQLVVSVIDSSNTSCFNVCDGSAVAAVTGGTPNYTFLWSNAAVNDTIVGLCDGSYRITVTDANGCTAADTVVITEPTQLIVTIDTVQNASCFAVCDGKLLAIPTGGTPGYLYNWSNGSFIDSATALCAGIYFVTLTDANGCEAFDTATITEPAPLVADITAFSNASCFNVCDGEATVTVSGGTNPYSYLWSPPSNATQAIATSLCDGFYTITATDSNGCTATDTITITEPTLLTADIVASTDLSCNASCDGTATVVPAGGTAPYTYLWDNNAIDSIGTGFCAGIANVTVTDANGCQAQDSVLLLEPPVLTATINSSTDASCFQVCDGTARVTPSGGTAPYTYSWSNTATTDSISGLCAGTYIVTVTDANGCQASDTIVIDEPLPVVLTMGQRNVSCNGANDGRAWYAVTGGNGGFVPQWSSGSPIGVGDTTTGLAPGQVTVTVTDALGCSATGSVNITEPAPLVANLTVVDVRCFGGSDGRIFATVTGGTAPYQYVWSGGVPIGQGDTAVNMTAGTYCVTVTDANGCQFNICDTVNQPAAPLTITLTSTNVTCFGACDGTGTVTPAGGTSPYTYVWSDGQTGATASNLCPGAYGVTVRDANNCVAFNTIAITEPAQLQVSIVVDSNTNCNGGATGGLTVSLTGGTAPYDYNWSPGSVPSTTNSFATTNSVNGLGVNTYTVSVVDSNGCTQQISATITEREGPVFGGLDVTPTTCGLDNGTIILDFTSNDGPINYNWSPSPGAGSNGNVSGLANTTYTVTVTDNADCDTIMVIDVPAVDQPSIDSIYVKGAYCDREDGRIEVYVGGGVAPYTYVWSHDTTATSYFVNNLEPGDYTVTVSDANGCDSTLNFTIDDVLAPDIEITQPALDTIYLGQSVEIFVTVVSSVDSMTYEWEPTSGLNCTDCFNPTASPEQTTAYMVTATDTATGCIDTAFFTVIVKDDQNIFVPNAITPNGDGINDVWVIRDLEIFPDNEIIIMNRWGDEVFRASPYMNNWGGTYNNKLLPAATYYYVLKLNNISEAVTGSITIVK
ncbi:MAG: gliding motility-associated C-terminal domain-containing protein [Chitinophagales bacterium]|nr:gliding motility-associated C-terminal domain-containing protein [Chitinophagales bacterium]